MSSQRSLSRVLMILVPTLILATGGAAWANLGSGLFINSPGSSGSLAAGLVNPAAWAVQGSGGTLLAIEHPDETEEFGDLNWTFIGSGEHLAFAYQNFRGLDDERIQNWTLGTAFGDRSFAGGFSYQWFDDDYYESNRWNFGLVKRARTWSLGLSGNLNEDFAEGNYLADLGLRPFGPRLTLFGEGSYLPFYDPADVDSEEYRFNYGFGAEIMAMPGLSISGRYNLAGWDADESSFSLGLQLSFGGGDRSAYIAHMGEVSDGQGGTSTEFTGGTYVSESGRSGSILPFSWQGAKYPEMKLGSGAPYRRFAWFDDGQTFKGQLDQINHYAENPKTEGLVINMSGFGADPETAAELRDQLAGLRAAGKKIIIYIDRVSLFSYTLASVADELWIDPVGSIDVTGLAAGMTYRAEMLEKLGVGFEEIRLFKYKSAYETFSRMEMSEGQKEQYLAIIDDWYETSVATATGARAMSRETWDRAVEEYGDLMAEEALELGFVDKIGSWHDMKENLDEVAMRQTADPSATRLAGLYGDPVWRDEHWGGHPTIALLYAEGPCAMESGIKGRLLSKKIREARENRNVKAVVMRADSGGGDALPSDLVSRELKLTMEKKPFIVTQGYVAGSGGYWISMYSDKIVASPYTITGSIGVISGHFYDNGLDAKIGSKYQGVQRGSHADLYRGSSLPLLGTLPHRPHSEEELTRHHFVIQALYDEFVAKVAEGRGMTVEAVDEVGRGRIWSGLDGRDIGLVDELGGLWLALQLAKEAAGIDADMPVNIAEGPELGSFNMSLFAPKLFGIEAETVEKAANPLAAYFGERDLEYLETLANAKGEPVTMMEPFQIIDGAEIY